MSKTIYTIDSRDNTMLEVMKQYFNISDLQMSKEINNMHDILVELLEKKESVCLYIGESVWIASRCGVHLYSLYENPNYFGLTKEDIDNDEFTLKFSVIDSLNEKKSVLGVGQYKNLELDAIRRNKPLTQLETSDRQIRDVQEKIKRVQDELLKKGFK